MNTSDQSDDELSNSLLFGKPKPVVESEGFPFLEPALTTNELGWLADFRVLKVLGKGGMGIVFEAEDTALRRIVALKVLRPELSTDKENRERFLREARAAAALASDYVVTIFQVGTVGQTPFLAMQFLQGLSLQDRLERPPQLGVLSSLMIARQVAAGLVDAHAAGLIHRDIKPANIWLEADAPEGAFKRVRLLDFGLARCITGDAGLTATGIVMGTPNYMAPEQASGETIDTRADLFSLGCVLYVMLTGELAFPGKSTMSVFMSLASQTPVPVGERNPDVPYAVNNLVNRLLAKNPAGRPQSAGEVLAILEAETAGQVPLTPNLTSQVSVSSSASVPVSPTMSETLGSAKHDTQPDETLVVRRRRRRIWTWAGLSGGAVAIGLMALLGWKGFRPGLTNNAIRPAGEPIKVGVLHSRTGHMAVSENPVVDATMLAIDELNRSGGVLGRPVHPVVADGMSDPDKFGQEAERLISQEKVAAIFGCWTSASRKAVREVVERDNGLLFYPVQYEGLEQSPRIIYLGPTPNQQILPALEYLVGSLGKKRLALVGSDYVFPHAAHAIINDWVKQRPGVMVVAEHYIPLGSKDTAEVVDSLIAESNPDAIINTINGSTNFFFFKALRAEGLTNDRVPTLSVSVSENELRALDPAAMAGDYLTATYFQSVDRPENHAFIEKVRTRFDRDRTTSDMMQAAYAGVHLWAKTAAAAGTVDPQEVSTAVRNQEFLGPGGLFRIDPETGHAWRPWRLGQVKPDGSVEVIAGSGGNLQPLPFPLTRTRREWERFLYDLYIGWDNRWQAPAPTVPEKGKP